MKQSTTIYRETDADKEAELMRERLKKKRLKATACSKRKSQA